MPLRLCKSPNSFIQMRKEIKIFKEVEVKTEEQIVVMDKELN